MVQSEVDARRRLLEVKKSTAEQRWAVEDLQVLEGGVWVAWLGWMACGQPW